MSPRRKQEERSVLRLVVQSDSPRKRVLRCRRPKAETDARPPIESSQYLLRASRHREEVEAIPARGSGTGVGLGTGPGTTSASGSGAGSGSGKGSLPGLTIQGTNGAYGNGAAVVKSHVDGIKLPAQTAYGMTVVSLASSGGGLPDWACLRMRRSIPFTSTCGQRLKIRPLPIRCNMLCCSRPLASTALHSRPGSRRHIRWKKRFACVSSLSRYSPGPVTAPVSKLLFGRSGWPVSTWTSSFR